jgi:hypothetical protein
MGAKARIGALAFHRLMHNRHIRLNPENVIGYLDDADLFAGLVVHLASIALPRYICSCVQRAALTSL